MNIKKNDEKSTELIKKTEVENSPFVIITTEREGKTVNFVTFGKYRITDTFESTDQAIEYINNMTWNMVITVASLLYDMMFSNNQISK